MRARRELPSSERMEFPVARVPIDEALHVEGDAASGKVLCDSVVVARGVSRTAVSLGQPILVKLDVDAVAPSSDRMNIAVVVAESISFSISISVRVRSTSIDRVVGCGTVTIGQVWQIDSVNLNQG